MWQPADHDQPARDNAAAVSPEPATGANGDVLVDVTWTRDCAQCHGMSGRGDGPEGRMVRAPDLTRLDWQEAVTDEQIAAIIANGRGKMPKFDLPERTLQGLVRKVRSLVPPR